MIQSTESSGTDRRQAILLGLTGAAATAAAAQAQTAVHAAPGFPVTHHRTATVEGVKIFYREAGPANAPVVLLLHV